MASFSQKGYQFVAETLRDSTAMLYEPKTTVDLALDFAARFEADNPRFDRDRFLAVVEGVRKK